MLYFVLYMMVVLVVWVLWHIKLYWLFNAKSILYEKLFYFK